MTDKDFNYAAHDENDQAIAKGGVACPFPWRLHEMLKVTEEEGLQPIVSWCSHGRAFLVRKPKEFAAHIMTKFFSQTKYASFQRQLNMYGFNRFAHGKDKGAYYHICFVRGHCSLVRDMVRRKVKGTKVRRVPVEEPDFYHAAWKNHVMGTVPPGLEARQVDAPVSGRAPILPVPCLSSQTTQAGSHGTPQYTEILPAPPKKPEAAMPVSDSDDASWDSMDTSLTKAEAIFFEGSPFHFLETEEDPSAFAVLPDAPALADEIASLYPTTAAATVAV